MLWMQDLAASAYGEPGAQSADCICNLQIGYVIWEFSDCAIQSANCVNLQIAWNIILLYMYTCMCVCVVMRRSRGCNSE